MAIFRRTQEDDVPVIYSGVDVAGMGTISGRKVGSTDVADAGTIGFMTAGRAATDANLKGARRHLMEVDAGDLDWGGDREVVDLGSGAVYEVLLSDPLSEMNPGSAADLFTVSDGRLVFLRSTGTTVAEREATLVEQQRLHAQVEEERAKRRARERQVPIPLSVVFGERMSTSLRAAARVILDAGGQVKAGENGTLSITVPEVLTNEPLAARAAWAEVGTAAEVLCRSSRVVLTALAQVAQDKSRSPRGLLERLPDSEVVFE
jgi:hypothetical protein